MSLTKQDKLDIKEIVTGVMVDKVGPMIEDGVRPMIESSEESLATMMKKSFDDVDRQFAEVKREFAEVHTSLDGLKRDNLDIRFRVTELARKEDVTALTDRVGRLERKVFPES